MIRLEKQALTLNAAKVPGPGYRMDQTVKLTKTATPEDVVNHIQTALNSISEPILKNLVVNSHGGPGMIYVGEKEVIVDCKKKTENIFIGIEHIGLFTQFKNKIDTIWLTGCQTAGSGIYRSGTFCSQLARTISCNVVAADVLQYINPGYYLKLFPKNCIDEFEGTAYKWDANGNKQVFSRRDWLKI